MTDIQSLTPQAVSAMRPGAEIDRLVHEHVMRFPEPSGRKRVPRYSESPLALAVLSVVPIEVGRFRDTDPEFQTDPDHPYFGRITVGPTVQPKIYQFKTTTPELALCKAAIFYRVATS